jgi:hypothetical protein
MISAKRTSPLEETLMKKTLLTAALTLALGGCAAMQQAKEVDDLIAEAEKEIAAAKKTNFTWRDTEKFLGEAKKARDAGDMEGATKSAKKALGEAKLAQKQAQDNAAPKVHYPN